MLRALTFGQCAFETPVARIAPDSEVHFGLLLSIVSAPADGVARDEVVSRLWPRAAGEDGRHCLRQAMYRLRQLGVSVQLNAGRIVLHDARSALDVHSLLYGTPTQAELVRLGAMSFLPSYEPSLGESFDHWLETLRERVAMRLCRALADEVASTRSRGRFHDMGHVARALLVLDPLNELATMVLAESLALQGSKVEALRLLEEYEVEVGAVNRNLQLPARVLRRRVAEVLDDGLQLRQFEVPFVGREREFCALRTLWRDVRGGHARAVIVSGEAGIGKSRLAGELVRLAALDGGRVARYTTSAGDSFTPISTLVSVGQQLLTLPGALGCAAEQLSYIRRLGTPESVSAWSVAGMAADVLYAQLVHAFAELVSAIAEEAPLIISVDDAERLHPTTWRVLVDIWDRVGRRGVLFLLAARRLPPWFGSLGTRSCERLTQHLPIAAFSREESHEFVHAWSAQNRTTVSDGMVALLASISRGNPFYLTELAAHVGHGGDPDQTPSTILDLIGAQCRVLSKAAHRVLVVIAVLESRATTARVTRVLEQPASDFMAALDELEEAGLVTTQGPAVRVRHRLVDEVARSLAMPSVVDFAHGRAAAVLESEADATLSVELLGDCVTHWERAGETRRAYEAAMKLGYRLVGLGMGEEAKLAFRSAYRCSATDDERLQALSGSISASRLCAAWHEVLSLCDERRKVLRTAALASTAEDEFLLFESEARIFAFASHAEAQRLTSLAAQESRKSDFRLQAATVAAMIADNNYDPAGVRCAFDAAKALLDSPHASNEAYLLQLIYHTSVGQVTHVHRIALQYANISREAGEKRLTIHGLRRAANALVRVGHYDEALPLLMEALATATRLGLPRQIFATSDILTSTYLLSGNLAPIRTELQRQREILEAIDHDEAMTAMLSYSSAQLAWLTRDVALAEEELKKDGGNAHQWLAAAEFCSLIRQLATQLLADPTSIRTDDVSRCLALFRKGSGLGRQDINASVLLGALRHVRKSRTALSMESSYKRMRRELSPGVFQLALVRARESHH